MDLKRRNGLRLRFRSSLQHFEYWSVSYLICELLKVDKLLVEPEDSDRCVWAACWSTCEMPWSLICLFTEGY